MNNSHLFHSVILKNKYIWKNVRYFLNSGRSDRLKYRDITDLSWICRYKYWYLLKDKIKNDFSRLGYNPHLFYQVIESADLELVMLVYSKFKNTNTFSTSSHGNMADLLDLKLENHRDFFYRFLNYLITDHPDIYIPSIEIEKLLAHTNSSRVELDRYWSLFPLVIVQESLLPELACRYDNLMVVMKIFDQFIFKNDDISVALQNNSHKVLDYIFNVKERKCRGLLICALLGSNIDTLNMYINNTTLWTDQISSIDINRLINANHCPEVFHTIYKEILKHNKTTSLLYLEKRLTQDNFILLLKKFDISSLEVMFKQFKFSQFDIDYSLLANEIICSSFLENQEISRMEVVLLFNPKIKDEFAKIPMATILEKGKETLELDFITYLYGCGVNMRDSLQACIANCKDRIDLLQFFVSKHGTFGMPISTKVNIPPNVHNIRVLKYLRRDRVPCVATVDTLYGVMGKEDVDMTTFLIQEYQNISDAASNLLENKMLKRASFLVENKIVPVTFFKVEPSDSIAAQVMLKAAIEHGNLKIINYIYKTISRTYNVSQITSTGLLGRITLPTLDYLLKFGIIPLDSSVMYTLYSLGNIDWVEYIFNNYEVPSEIFLGRIILQNCAQMSCKSNKIQILEAMMQEMSQVFKISMNQIQDIKLSPEPAFLEYVLHHTPTPMSELKFLTDLYKDRYHLPVVKAILKPMKPYKIIVHHPQAIPDLIKFIFTKKDISICHWYMYHFPTEFLENIDQLFTRDILLNLPFHITHMILNQLLTKYPKLKQSDIFYEWMSIIALTNKQSSNRIHLLKLVSDTIPIKLDNKHKEQVNLYKEILQSYKYNNLDTFKMGALVDLKRSHLDTMVKQYPHLFYHNDSAFVTPNLHFNKI
ncbi:hypothetical protein DLAC_05779 [Tieghemostelium lacteum]|uniref:Uncharacterized protein n=1 Tax=Tieghemostelium lacteum TaxID=361077 RepID=A0A151ZGP7_TIELA|nr:hypothetical protein DLAC_05779 [Tieghemostelium lacteum]|eukprot:KYQ93146.1 hypothetical protein DLAC_05779 [Tieghemostelium lacteum]